MDMLNNDWVKHCITWEVQGEDARKRPGALEADAAMRYRNSRLTLTLTCLRSRERGSSTSASVLTYTSAVLYHLSHDKLLYTPLN